MPSPVPPTKYHVAIFSWGKIFQIFLNRPLKKTQQGNLPKNDWVEIFMSMDNGVHSEQQKGSLLESRYSHAEDAVCMTHPMWSQCCHFLFATCPYQHRCFFFSLYLPILTMCQRGEICPVLFRKVCCPELKRDVSSALASDCGNGCYCMSADPVERQKFQEQLIRREKSSILQTLVTW